MIEPAYLHLKNLVFQHQTGNGLNTDDGGSYDTPAHHVVFEACTFRDMSASGNNDLLKLSGLDDFVLRNCLFINGAAGGSGVDMVGCHRGLITGNRFENMGSNAIQCKGGSEQVRIEANFFKNGGLRTLNLGGSTGLAFFRPDTAHFEAANLQVFSNIFIGSEAPIAYVGSVNVDVAHNTFYKPLKWVVRILQETVDPDRFLPCGNNFFRNNLIYLGNLPTETNIGPNTLPETFTYANNLWYNDQNNNWPGPDIPVTDPAMLVNADPLFVDAADENFQIPGASPAAGAGQKLTAPARDFYGQLFADPPSVGAVEAHPVSGVKGLPETSLTVFPNPFSEGFRIDCRDMPAGALTVQVFSPGGQLVLQEKMSCPGYFLETNAPNLPAGIWIVQVVDSDTGATYSARLVKK